MCVKPLSLKRKVTGVNINAKDMFFYTVPCGKCPECTKAKVNSWLFRLDQELKRSTNPLFVTLTYATEHLTYGKDFPTLVKSDLQKFFKRLRKIHEKKYPKVQIKYYACGEYGTKSKRPHYHIILFNLQDTDLVHTAWGMGHTMSLPLRNGGTAYVLKYLHKPPQKKTNDMQPEFSLMSKKMGDNYLTESAKKYHLNRVENSFVVMEGGYKLPMPKYYKEKIFHDEDERKKVTNYLQKRADQSANEILNLLSKSHPQKDENFILNLVEESKYLTKFDKRINDVL